MLRLIGGVFAGLAAGCLVIAAAEWIGHGIFPPPSGIDFTDRAQVEAAMKAIPVGALVLVLAGWGLGGFAGASLAIWLAQARALAGRIVIGLLFIAAALNLMMVPHPLWMMIATPLVFIAAALAASRLFAAR